MLHDHPQPRARDHERCDQGRDAARLQPERAGAFGADGGAAQEAGRDRGRRPGLYLRHAAGCGQQRQRGGARDAGGARSEGSGGQQRPLWGAPLEIARAIGVPCTALELPITEPVAPEQVDAALAADSAISHLAVCHVDTGTGLLNPIEPLAEIARRRKVALIVDAIASFGGLPIDARGLGAEAIVLSANKWLEGVPGMALVLVRRAALEAAAGRCHSFCLDLHRQWRSHETHGGGASRRRPRRSQR